jgi:hypothetical protein
MHEWLSHWSVTLQGPYKATNGRGAGPTLGGYSGKLAQLKPYDVAVLKCKGENAATNFETF